MLAAEDAGSGGGVGLAARLVRSCGALTGTWTRSEALGLGLLLATAIIWTASSFLTEVLLLLPLPLLPPGGGRGVRCAPPSLCPHPQSPLPSRTHTPRPPHTLPACLLVGAGV